MAGYIFEQEGKLLRPKFAMVLARALLNDRLNDELIDKIKRWSAVIEMIHNSSLLQVELYYKDDIIDEANTRRGRATAHHLFGKTKTSALPLFIVGRA